MDKFKSRKLWACIVVFAASVFELHFYRGNFGVFVTWALMSLFILLFYIYGNVQDKARVDNLQDTIIDAMSQIFEVAPEPKERVGFHQGEDAISDREIEVSDD